MPGLMELAGKRKAMLTASCILLIIASASSVAPFYLIYLLLLDLFDPAAGGPGAWLLLSLLPAAYAITSATLILGYELSHRAAYEILYEIRMMLGKKLVRLSPGYFNEKSTGELKTVMNENVEMLEFFLAHHLPEMVTTVSVPLFIGLFLLAMDWRMALAAILPVALAVIVVLAYGMMGWERLMREYLATQAEANAATIEYVQGIKVIKAFNRAADSFRKYGNSLASWRDTMARLSEERALPFTVYQALITSTLIAILPVGIWLYGTGQVALGTLLLFIIVGPLFGGLFMRIYDFLRYYIEEKECMDRINNVLGAPEVPGASEAKAPSGFSIEFKGVNFFYDKEPVLHDVSFFIPEGSKCALVGPSGAGKTTVARLVSRFWDATGGEVLIGGVDVRHIPPEKLLSFISVVFQEAFLFDDTVLENIRMGRPGAPMGDVVRATKAAMCHDFIERLPKGYDTRIGEKGATLSGGERQRIAIARALLKDAPIVLLDEATVFVDPDNERLIQEGISSLTEGKTVLVIAHKLSTIVNVEQILVMERGKIVERGRHNELVAEGRLYGRLWEDYVSALEWGIRSHV